MDSKILIPFLAPALLSSICFVMAFFQFKGKGFLFNNAYIFASKQERVELNKTPYYRQSAIAFSGLGANFLLLASYILLRIQFIKYLSFGLMLLLVVYALWSTVRMMTKSK